MYLVIPLDHQNIFESFDDNIKHVQSKSCFVTGLHTVAKLINHNDYPVKKDLAIVKIIQFLKYVESIMKDNDKVTIHSDVFKEYFLVKHASAFKKILAELNILSVVEHDQGYGNKKFYSPGEFAMQYTFFTEHKEDNDLALFIILKNKHSLEMNVTGKFPAKFMRTIKDTAIDYRAAIRAEIAHYNDCNKSIQSLKSRLNNILALNDSRYIKSGDKSNRIYHSLSNISKVARPFLTYKGQSFAGIDIVNAQPLLLCALLKSLNMPVDQQYIQQCEAGTIYEMFYDAAVDDTDGELRKAAKVALYSSIYFYFKPYDQVNMRFKQLYPLTYASLQILDKDQDTLASKLQNMEASIINPIVPKHSIGYYGLFDGIYCTDESDLFIMKEQIITAFRQYDITPQIKIEK